MKDCHFKRNIHRYSFALCPQGYIYINKLCMFLKVREKEKERVQLYTFT